MSTRRDALGRVLASLVGTSTLSVLGCVAVVPDAPPRARRAYADCSRRASAASGIPTSRPASSLPRATARRFGTASRRARVSSKASRARPALGAEDGGGPVQSVADASPCESSAPLRPGRRLLAECTLARARGVTRLTRRGSVHGARGLCDERRRSDEAGCASAFADSHHRAKPDRRQDHFASARRRDGVTWLTRPLAPCVRATNSVSSGAPARH